MKSVVSLSLAQLMFYFSSQFLLFHFTWRLSSKRIISLVNFLESANQIKTLVRVFFRNRDKCRRCTREMSHLVQGQFFMTHFRSLLKLVFVVSLRIFFSLRFSFVSQSRKGDLSGNVLRREGFKIINLFVSYSIFYPM